MILCTYMESVQVSLFSPPLYKGNRGNSRKDMMGIIPFLNQRNITQGRRICHILKHNIFSFSAAATVVYSAPHFHFLAFSPWRQFCSPASRAFSRHDFLSQAPPFLGLISSHSKYLRLGSHVAHHFFPRPLFLFFTRLRPTHKTLTLYHLRISAAAMAMMMMIRVDDIRSFGSRYE